MIESERMGAGLRGEERRGRKEGRKKEREKGGPTIASEEILEGQPTRLASRWAWGEGTGKGADCHSRGVDVQRKRMADGLLLDRNQEYTRLICPFSHAKFLPQVSRLGIYNMHHS